MIMYRRLAKEFRALLLPTCVAAAAACAMSLFAAFSEPSGAGPEPFLFDVSSFVFFGSIAVAAGMALGVEFLDHRTALKLD